MAKKKVVRKEYPNWVKVLAILSVLAIIAIIIYSIVVAIGISAGAYDAMGLLIFPLFIIPLLLAILIMWGLGYLTRFLLRKRLNTIATVISVVGGVIFLIWSLVIFFATLITASTNPYGADPRSLASQTGAGLFYSVMIFLPFVYFLVTFIYTIKHKK